jgi:hypothetical protein
LLQQGFAASNDMVKLSDAGFLHGLRNSQISIDGLQVIEGNEIAAVRLTILSGVMNVLSTKLRSVRQFWPKLLVSVREVSCVKSI